MSQRVRTRKQLADLPTPSPFIRSTLDLGTVALLAGYYGSLKSFIALDMFACAATGFAWNRREVEPGKVLYIAGEGAYGLHQRLNAWEEYRQTEIPSEGFQVLPEAVNLGDDNAVREVADLITAERFRYVAVDTLAKCMPAMDENSARDMGIAVTNLYRLRAATVSGTVLAVHHTGKDRSTIRGSSALEAGVDCVYKTEGDASLVQLTRTKRKDGPLDDVHRLAFQAVAGSESGVVVSQSGLGLRPGTETLLSHFQSHFGATGASGTQLFEVSGVPRATFYRSLNELVTGGVLVNTGTSKRPFYKEAS
ncbi:AAA family ATPase [Nakamurella panacisegetis]|uniref:AAA family ATPase n=1 Tax=Nakamurella panacisegetis TaxID=1090615 RepID=UPI0012FD44B8|nr:AAA family ATPase [Nakamurella panacisegetis]